MMPPNIQAPNEKYNENTNGIPARKYINKNNGVPITKHPIKVIIAQNKIISQIFIENLLQFY